MILVYRDSLFARAAKWTDARSLKRWVAGDLVLLNRNGQEVGICGEFGIGAPATALVMEQLLALGVRRLITVGTAGGLQESVSVGDIVICDRAIRDEGLSHHYIQPGKYIIPRGTLSNRLARRLDGAGLTYHRGTSWTTDAPYRETAVEVDQYRREGVITVEMEAAGVFAVAQHRGIEVAAAFVVSDSLSGPRGPRSDQQQVQHPLDALLQTAVAALAENETRRSETERL